MSSQAVRFAPHSANGRSSLDQQSIAVSNPLTAAGDDVRTQEEFEKQKIGHRRIDKQGEITYKRVPTNDLMGAIQLGIANSIGSMASIPVRDILFQDFAVVETVSFPSSGSQTTPSHGYGDFRFSTYAPFAFRTFRELFHIKAADFLRSLCTEPMQELSNAGASGSIFYVSADDQFIVKTVQHKEADFLQKLLPGYYMNFNQNPHTLLPKFFGLFCYQTLGKNIRLLVMNNLLPQSMKMHEKYDLKGSTYKRYASKSEKAKSSPTLKDLDFVKEHPEGFFLEAAAYDALVKTLSRDCLVLESFKIMDYSLLVGVHIVEIADGNTTDEDGESNEPSSSNKKLRKTKSRFWDMDSTLSPGVFPARNHKGQAIVLFLGIIDILQNYRLFKKFEHAWKSLLYEADSVSVHNPSFYAQRFQAFLKEKVIHSSPTLRHSPSKRRAARRSGSEKEKEKEKDETDVLPGASLVTRTEIMPIAVNRAPGRRSYNRQEVVIEKPREKKVERLFAPEPESRNLAPQESLSEDETVVGISPTEIFISASS